MATQPMIARDTTGWMFQVWIAFVSAVLACGWGVMNLPGQDLDRAFLAIGFFFCIFAAFALAKMMRDNRQKRVDTAHWIMTVWAGFIIAIVLTGWGLSRMQIGVYERAYMLVSWLFLLSSVFTLAKMIRDRQDHDQLEKALRSSPDTIPQ